MDAFYASVEEHDDPSLVGKAVAVGGGSARGVVATANYEARKYGVHSAMPGFKAKQKCPHLIFVKPRFSRYKEISKIIRSVFFEYTDLVEPLSLDEAYLDVSENKFEIESAIKIAKQIKEKIKKETGLTASAGVSTNKFLAKVASDLHKPDGLSVILPEDVQLFIDELPIEKFYGIGKATAKRMKLMNINYGKDLAQLTELELVTKFGKFGRYLYKVCGGNDDREVKPERVRKSISVERTFEKNLENFDEILEKLNHVCDMLKEALLKTKIKGRTINLKVRFDDFSIISKSKSVTSYTNDIQIIENICLDLLSMTALEGKGVRLLGVGLSTLNTERKESQLELEL